MALPSVRGLGQSLSLPSLSKTLSASEGLLDQVKNEYNWLVDLPSNAYSTIMKVPDQIGVREKLDALGTEALQLAVPIANQVGAAMKRASYSAYLQPLLIGKIFAAHDYVQTRKALLKALPQLPDRLRAEAEGAAAFLRNHERAAHDAFGLMPAPRELSKLRDRRVLKRLMKQMEREQFEALTRAMRRSPLKSA